MIKGNVMGCSGYGDFRLTVLVHDFPDFRVKIHVVGTLESVLLLSNLLCIKIQFLQRLTFL